MKRITSNKRAPEGTLTPVPACGGVTLGPGETLVAITCGGGGYGAPSERDARAVRHAIREGLITPTRAETIYGLTDDQGSGPPSIG